MENAIRRIYVEKRQGYDIEAKNLLSDLRSNLALQALNNVRVINRYDIAGITEDEYKKSRDIIFSEKTVDYVYEGKLEIGEEYKAFAVEYLPGQYDQRADSACQCIQILTQKDDVAVNSSKLIILQGDINQDDVRRVKTYYINPVDSREASLEEVKGIDKLNNEPSSIITLSGFLNSDDLMLQQFIEEYNLAMSKEDLGFCRNYFKNVERREPSITELKVIDTYWSDHCRHTTFMTTIKNVDIEDGEFSDVVKSAFEEYLECRAFVYVDKKKDACLMDLATIGMKELKKKGLLKDIDESDEINACSIEIDVDIDGEYKKWLIMFKNETHNHPTEIEPFGGAATCLGGAIRDPLSGRAYVYQAMRVTGSGDPRTKFEDTLQGKLPQRKITIGAAQGYSSYGNQIGLATGQVSEVYDDGFLAKRMEVGAVIGAVPKENVVREKPIAGDIVVLIGGRTGRDGCGGATGSSKEHTEQSILNCGAEVQKGNPPTERKIQRLFRNPKVSAMIKKCNDFGAGGVSVAIGELADGLIINLDRILKKYEGLDGTELAISESQERMAVVISKENLQELMKYAYEENVEAAVVAEVTQDKRLKMLWRGNCIVDISREFLNTNGVRQSTNVVVKSPDPSYVYFGQANKEKTWITNLKDINICSQKGLVERFDSTIGAATVLMPFGGKYQNTPAEGMAAKIPLLKGDTKTVSIMTYGYNPKIGKWSPFHGALYAVLEAVTKVVVMGGDYRNIRLSLQEYFEKLGKDPEKWGKPFSALLGALHAQKMLEIPAIGGKDSMSGTFKDINVPPTVAAFAVCVSEAEKIVSSEFKHTGSKVVMLSVLRDKYELPDFQVLKKNYDRVSQLISCRKILSACSVRHGGISEAISKMCIGNLIGFKFRKNYNSDKLFSPDYGSMILELEKDADLNTEFEGINYEVLGYTQQNQTIEIGEDVISLDEVLKAWQAPLEEIFRTETQVSKEKIEDLRFNSRNVSKPSVSIARPRVIIPVFPGTNCEYDSIRAFEKAGGMVDTFIFKNLNSSAIEDSIEELVKRIGNSQIIMLPGGFSAGDEPDGSGKFIAAVFRNNRVKEAVTEFLKVRDGLMLGICNGFQALIKLGLVPYGEIRDLDEKSPTLTFNKIGRHVSCVVKTKIVSNLSPWFNKVELGDIHSIPVSHGEGCFKANQEEVERLISNGQIATQYVDFDGRASYEIKHNPNGSFYAVEGITSPDGRILGKMGHSERIGTDILKNIPGEKNQRLFESGVNYFK